MQMGDSWKKVASLLKYANFVCILARIEMFRES